MCRSYQLAELMLSAKEVKTFSERAGCLSSGVSRPAARAAPLRSGRGRASRGEREREEQWVIWHQSGDRDPVVSRVWHNEWQLHIRWDTHTPCYIIVTLHTVHTTHNPSQPSLNTTTSHVSLTQPNPARPSLHTSLHPASPADQLKLAEVRSDDLSQCMTVSH